MQKSLNLGCGDDLWGDVRVDCRHDFMNVHNKPTVLADAHYLPFKDGSFENAQAIHLLEHLPNPLRALNEMSRVTTHELLLKFPTEHDIIPALILNSFPIPIIKNLRTIYGIKRNGDHLWVIQPKVIMNLLGHKGWSCKCDKGTLCIIQVLDYPRFKKLSNVFTQKAS